MVGETNKRHVHADLIIAWAEGAEIEIKINGEWRPLIINFPFREWEGDEYRIVPKASE